MNSLIKYLAPGSPDSIREGCTCSAEEVGERAIDPECPLHGAGRTYGEVVFLQSTVIQMGDVADEASKVAKLADETFRALTS